MPWLWTKVTRIESNRLAIQWPSFSPSCGFSKYSASRNTTCSLSALDAGRISDVSLEALLNSPSVALSTSKSIYLCNGKSIIGQPIKLASRR